MSAGPCPLPHEGVDGVEGYCPECGLLLPAAVDRRPPVCPVCNTLDEHDARYCEGCGRDRTAPAPTLPSTSPPSGDRATPRRWSVHISVDRRLFDAVQGAAQGFVLPEEVAWQVALDGPRIRIGRSDGRSRAPEIDLENPPSDPGVSREHAELTRRGDAGWELRDRGSRNGTWVDRSRLRPGEIAYLTGGERIRVGLWSRLELVADDDR